MRRQIIIDLPQDFVNYVEAQWYDFEGISFLISNMKNISDEDKKFWLDEFDNRNQEYSLTKKFIEEEYVIPKLKDNERANWKVNFINNTLEVDTFDIKN